MSEDTRLDLMSTVKDAIYAGASEDDEILNLLLRLAAVEIRDGRRLFENPLDEPIFWSKHFKVWVRDSLEKVIKMEEE
jgi:hypothetical protein